MQNTLRFRENVVTFSVSGLTMVGNLDTGGVIGLTAEGNQLCARLAGAGVRPEDVPESCAILVAHLDRGGYLSSSLPKVPKQSTLSSAYLHVTQRCNLSCRFCYSEDATRNTSSDPSLDDLLRAVDLLANMGCRRLVVSGGEPFLRDDLNRIAFHAKGQGIENIAILTNGTVVTRERIEPLRGLVDSVAVAFDGPSQDSPAHLRGEQRFDQLVKAVRVIGGCGILPVILPTIHAKNLNDMPRYKELAVSLGAQLQFSLLTAPNEALGSFALDTKQLRRLASLSVQEDASVQDSTVGGPIAVRQTCGAGVRTLSVAADGTVYPCHMLHRPEFAMGNAYIDTSNDIFGSSVARTFGELSVDSFEGCTDCQMRYPCGGGCRARAFLDAGNIKSHDVSCELYRLYFEGRLDALRRKYGTT